MTIIVTIMTTITIITIITSLTIGLPKPVRAVALSLARPEVGVAR